MSVVRRITRTEFVRHDVGSIAVKGIELRPYYNLVFES
jgi:hypothetical protein